MHCLAFSTTASAPMRTGCAICWRPTSWINSPVLHTGCAAPARIVNHQSLEGDQWASGELLALREIRTQPFGKETRPGDNGVGSPDSVQHQIAQTRAHRITHNKCAREHRHRRRHSQNHQQIRPPVIGETAANQRGLTHQ